MIASPRNQFVIHKAGILDSGLFRAAAGGRFFWAKLLTPAVSSASSGTGTPFARACSRGKTACARKSTRLVSLLLQLLQRYLQHSQRPVARLRQDNGGRPYAQLPLSQKRICCCGQLQDRSNSPDQLSRLLG